MRKRKIFLAMLLAAAVTVSGVTPAFAEELTGFSDVSAEPEADMQTDTLEVEEKPQEFADTSMELLEENVLEESADIPRETVTETPTPSEIFGENGEAAAEEQTSEEDLTDGSTEVITEEPKESEEPEEKLEEKLEEKPSGEGILAVGTVSVSVDTQWYDTAITYIDETTGELYGVAIYTYEVSADPETDDPVAVTYWYAADGMWTTEQNGEEFFIAPGVHPMFGGEKWNIQLVNEKSVGQGGYVLDLVNHTWAYYLTEEDVQDTNILSEVWKTSEYADIPARLFIGAKGVTENHAGLRTIDGEQYYLKEDGTIFTNGKQNVDGVIYIFGEDGKCTRSYILIEAGWVQRPDGYYWMQEDGSILREGGWQVLNGQRYFLKYKSGRRASGWETWSNGKYYLDPETGVVVTGMKEIDGQYYYFLPTGKTPGKMYTGWRTIDGKKYYFQSNGMRKKGWLTLNGKKYYFEKDGTQTYGWRSISGKKYYFDLKNGFMRKGWLTIGNNTYYMEKDGSLHTGWRSISGKKYYFLPKTGAMKKGWLTLNGKKYYFEKDGSLRYGWRSLGGKMYYFAPTTGLMQTGWLSLSNGRYYLGADGARRTGLQTIGGKNYYFGSDGKLITSTNAYRINGKYYSIDGNGVATPFSYAESLAAQKLDEIGWNLYAAFKWSSGQTGQFYYYHNDDTVPSGYTAADYYGIYGFENGRGDCYVMACTFYQMAKILGYDVHFVMGKVPLARGGWGPHGWCEIDLNGTTYVCDPDFTWDAKRNGYMITYGTPGTWVYSSYRRVN